MTSTRVAGISLAQLLERRIDVRDRALDLLDQVEGVGQIGADLVHPRSEALGDLRDLGNPPAGLLIDDLDRVLVADDVASDLLDLAADRVDRIAELVRDDGVAVAKRLQVLDQVLALRRFGV